MFNPKFLIRASDPKNNDIVAGLTELLTQAGQQVVSSENEAKYVIEVRASGEASSAYNIGTVERSAVGHGATTYNTGDISGANVNIGGKQDFRGDLNIATDQAHQQIVKSTGLSGEDKAELTDLLDMLYPALKRASVTNGEDQAAVAKVKAEAAKLTDEITSPKPDGAKVKVTAEGLVAAAKNLAVAAPYVGPIALEILKFVAKFTGG